MRDPNNPCLFCNISESGYTHENELAFVSYDSYPVSEHHCLIIPKRHIKDYFELSKDELTACDKLIKIVKEEIFLNHSLLSPLINSGILLPKQIINETIKYYKRFDR